jgi:muramidase (phage lysozyme)
MQFNSVKSGTFLAGAKSVNDNATEIYDTARRTGFQVDRVIKQANASDAVKKVAAARRNSAIVEQASDIIGDAKTEDIKTKGEKAVKDILRPAVRMEGVNRMAGSVAAGAYIMDESKKTRAEFAELKALRKKQAEARDAAAKKRAERDQALIDYLEGRNSPNPSTPNPASSSSSSSSTSQPSTSNTSANTSSNISNVTSLPLSGSSIMTPGWKKWGKVLRTGEGTLGDKGYTTMFGGGQFTDLSKHPDKVISKSGHNSSAAGAYQFLTPTWTGAAKALGLKDFSPESQEQAARYLTKNRGVDPDKIITDFQTFKDNLDKLAPEWASMPYQGVSPDGFGKGRSYYGQGGISAEEAWKIYQSS